MISIIVPCYNNENLLERCLHSIYKQTFEDYEVLVIDDGSTDNSIEICKRYNLLDSRFMFYSFENHGVSWARNKGIEYSKGEFIVFCDSDDFMYETMLEELYNNRNRADLILCGIEGLNLKTNEIISMIFGNGLVTKEEFGKLLSKGTFNPFFGGPYNKLFRSDIIKNYDISFNVSSSFAEDFCFNINYFYFCNSFYILDKNLYKYEFNLDTSLTNFNYKKLDAEQFFSQAIDAIELFYSFLEDNGVIHNNQIFLEIWKICISKVYNLPIKINVKVEILEMFIFKYSLKSKLENFKSSKVIDLLFINLSLNKIGLIFILFLLKLKNRKY